MFMAQTVEDVLAHSRADTEVIAFLDGDWPPHRGIRDDPRVKVVKTTVPVGQRAATNLGAQLSRAKYIMKLDAHCSVDEGFDVKILKEIIKLRKQDQDERDEHDSLLDVYMRAMDEAGPAPVAEAA